MAVGLTLEDLTDIEHQGDQGQGQEVPPGEHMKAGANFLLCGEHLAPGVHWGKIQLKSHKEGTERHITQDKTHGCH